MSDLPPEVENYFRARGKDPSKLNHIPKTRHAFKDLTQAQLDAIGMLNTLGEALEADFKDGNHVDKTADESVTPDEKSKTYLYAIH
jgi:hypothetical protein